MQPEQQLSKFVSTIEYENLPNGAVNTITRAVTDTIGVTLAGAVEGAGQTAAMSAEIDTNSTDAATLLGVTSTEKPPAAALRVGTASHALDYDDLSWGLDGHPSVTLVPPLLALADTVNA
ncbi:MmgE/PrpD family protein, partial [Haloquadratum walsbyi]